MNSIVFNTLDKCGINLALFIRKQYDQDTALTGNSGPLLLFISLFQEPGPFRYVTGPGSPVAMVSVNLLI
ncbi:MAG: hypothetical protein IPH20_07370 [Bacteroidales bacterium]|nr:hypothetical protein [Bacteroidales bacterium]